MMSESHISEASNQVIVSIMKKITFAIDSYTHKLKKVANDDYEGIAKISVRIKKLQCKYKLLENELKRRKRPIRKHS